MEDAFIEFLNSLGSPFGTWLAIILGGAAIIGGIVGAVMVFFKKYNARIESRIKKEEAEEKLNNTIQSLNDAVKNISEQITSIQTNITDMSDKQKENQREVQSKLDDVWTATIDIKRDSREGDVVLENQIKSYEHAIENINTKLIAMDEKSTLLIESDKEGIKSFITDKYYQAKHDKYIELHVLQSLELRYQKYLQENGNTYIGKLMERLRQMPNDPPTTQTNTQPDDNDESDD